MSADRSGANPTVWFLALEKLLFALPPLVGLGIAGVLRERGDPTIQSGLVVFAAVGAVALRIGIFLDATRLRSHTWRPNRSAYALSALAVSAPLVGLFYLYRRHERVGTPDERGFWWYLIVLSLVGAVSAIPLALVALAMALPDAFVAVPATVGAVALSVFPLAVYKDAAHVRSESHRWRPNPATYLALAFLSLAVTAPQPLVACYYLYRRHRTVGVP